MMALLSDPAVWASFFTLTVMEIVLGIDNIVFISVIINRLPAEQAEKARKLGLALALVFSDTFITGTQLDNWIEGRGFFRLWASLFLARYYSNRWWCFSDV